MKITIVTTMRNEGAHLLEWVAHHKAAGVTSFLVYVNDCYDQTATLLSLLPDVHVVEQKAIEKSPQWQALRSAWDHPLVQQADWLACIDCDEFINIDSGLRDIPHLIERVGGDAIMLPWRLFGAGDHVTLTEGSVSERFTQAASPDLLYPPLGSFFKTLFRREGPFKRFGVHRPKQKNSDRHRMPVFCDGSGAPMSESFAANDSQITNWGAPIANGLVQLNHYSVKSAADFLIKSGRGLPNRRRKPIDLTYWVERNLNHVTDTSISHMRSARVEVEAELLSIPGVHDALSFCRKWSRNAFESALATPDGLKLYGRLLLSSGSAMLPKAQALDLVDTYRRVHGAN